jgi:guanylate kinase
MTRSPTALAKRQGIIFILSAPSGAGKTTLYNRLKLVHPEIKLSVSCTTRVRRAGEVNGRDYRFITQMEFDRMKAAGEFAEWAKVHGNDYGTPRKPLDHSVQTGRDILLDIDVQGARQIKRSYPLAVSIFLLPPSLKELKRRLASRGTDGREIIERRLANAQGEIGEILNYDYYVENRDVAAAVQILSAIVAAERAKISRVAEWRLDSLLGKQVSKAHGKRSQNKRPD